MFVTVTLVFVGLNVIVWCLFTGWDPCIGFVCRVYVERWIDGFSLV